MPDPPDRGPRKEMLFMNRREIAKGVYWTGAVDWNRRLFDALIPLPDGTSYNAYLVSGSEKTALIDAVDPAMEKVLAGHLADIAKIDYIVANHAEQDHSGAIPMVMGKYPEAVVLCTPKAKPMLVDHLAIPEGRIKSVEDGEEVALGGKTLRFIHAPWVHWPETMVTYLPEERILFSCDFFGSHYACSEICMGRDQIVSESAKRYYAEIMMPFRKQIVANLKKVRALDIAVIAPSHGPAHTEPGYILSQYEEWVSERVANSVVIPYISMHGSTEMMVDRLTAELASRGVQVHKFDMSGADLGKLAITLVDAATIVIGTPTVLGGPHPSVVGAAALANLLRPKLKYAAVIGSYGWGTRIVEQVAALIPSLKVEMVGSVICKGMPRQTDLEAINSLASVIAEKHALL